MSFTPYLLSSPAIDWWPYFRCFAFGGLRFRHSFTLVIKPFTGGPSGNQMEDANRKTPVTVSWLSPCAVQPDRG